MAFTGGRTALTIATLSQKTTREELIAKLDIPYPPQTEETARRMAGWQTFDSPVKEAETFYGGMFYFQMVTSSKKVPSSLLKDECAKAEIAYRKSAMFDTVPSKERKRIKQEVKERLLREAPVIPRGTHIAIDCEKSTAYIASASRKEVDNIICLFHTLTGIELVPDNYAEHLQDLDAIKIITSAWPGDATMYDFLTWLWYFNEESGARLGEYEALVEGPLTLVNNAEEAKGAQIATLRKGSLPQVSAEAKAGLLIGKKLKKAKVTFCYGSDTWSLNLDADSVGFSGLSLPEGDAMAHEERFQESISNIERFCQIIKDYLNECSNHLKSDDIRDAIKTWAQEREGV
jgi:hypothetical protein